jgi:hypothetical protein
MSVTNVGNKLPTNYGTSEKSEDFNISLDQKQIKIDDPAIKMFLHA